MYNTSPVVPPNKSALPLFTNISENIVFIAFLKINPQQSTDPGVGYSHIPYMDN